MSTVYPFVPTQLPASVTLPQDLVDQRTAASVNNPMTAIGNGVAYLDEVITVQRRMACNQPVGQPEGGAIAKTINLKASSLEPIVEINWEAYGSYIRAGVPEVTDIGHHLLYRANELVVDGATFARLSAWVIGGPAHGALPAMMPAIGMVRYNPATDAWDALLSTTAGMSTDASSTVGQYEAYHEIRLNADQNNTIDLSTYEYYIVVCPEGGANAQEGLSFRSFSSSNTARRYQR